MSTAASLSAVKNADDQPQPFPGARFSHVSSLCRQAVAEGVFPGAVLSVSQFGKVVYRQSFGARAFSSEDAPSGPMSVETVFDVGSLTALMVTVPLIMKLVQSGKVSLDHKVSRYLQGFGVFKKTSITVGQLLAHCGGLPQWHPYYEELLKEHAGLRRGILTSRGAKDYVYNAVNRSPLKYEPGTRQLYSDIGLIVLGALIETVTGYELDRAAQRTVIQPLGLKSTSYIDLTLIRRRGIHPVRDLIAPTEECPWRKRVMCGEVHDDNAWAMGGIAGHAGLFTTVDDVQRFGVEMLRSYFGKSDFLKAQVVQQFWRPLENFPEGYRFGWDCPNKENGMENSRLGGTAVGHNSFTGCSLWLQPDAGVVIALLSNRVHPTRSNKKIQSFRPVLFDAVVDAVA